MNSKEVVHILHFGPGKVGKVFLQQLVSQKSAIKGKYGIEIVINGVFSSKGGIFKTSGLSTNLLKNIFTSKNSRNIFNPSIIPDIKQFASLLKSPAVIVDTTASSEIYQISLKALKKGFFVVMSNKKPLSSDQQIFNHFFRYQHRLFFETTVGAGLPVISTINKMIETGDNILNIKACLSGTIGLVLTLLEKGKPFSKAIWEAKKKGFTEPDPRDDLSGVDIGRKGLILSRLLGNSISLNDIDIQSLYPEKFKKNSIEEFMRNINQLDSYYNALFEKARKNNNTFRYVVEINRNSCTVKLKEVSLESDLGMLDGPDNIVIIGSQRYDQYPLVIKGPGAGIEVTAAGVFGDLLKIIRIVKGGKL